MGRKPAGERPLEFRNVAAGEIPSPSGRRWREAPDEGTEPRRLYASRRRRGQPQLPVALTPVPSSPAVGLQCSHISDRRADPFPSLLGKVARSAGWGVARCYDARKLARTLPRTCGPSALLSTPHPSPSATPSPLRGEGGARRPPAGSMTCVNAVELQGGVADPASARSASAPYNARKRAARRQRHTINALRAFASSARSGPFIGCVASPIWNLMALS